MKKPESLQFLIAGSLESKKWVPIACSPNHLNFLAHCFCDRAPNGGILSRELSKLSFRAVWSAYEGKLSVACEGDIVAEAAIFRPQNELPFAFIFGNLANELPENSPLRDSVREAFLVLQPPFCLMVWQKSAADRLSMTERQLVVAEIETLAGALVAILVGLE